MYSATAANLKLVSAAGLDFPSLAKCFPKRDVRFAAGLAPAVPRFQAEHVAATPRAGRPGVRGAHRGLCFMGMAGPTHLEPESRGKIYKIGALDGTCTHTLPADNGLLFYSATRAKW